MIVKPAIRKRFFRAKLTQAALVVAVFVLSIASLAPFASFNQSASALEPWETGGWKQLSVNNSQVCAIASNDQAYCWGANNSGQLGDNSKQNSSTPVAVDNSGVLSGKTINSISAGAFHTCAIASDGLAYCWGENYSGQHGSDSIYSTQVPVAVDTSGVLAGKTILSIATATDSTCAIASDNQAYCWGGNYDGQLGSGSTDEASSTPVAVDTSGVLSGKNIISISSEGYNTCVIASDNQAYCWGANWSGQLGDNSTDEASSTPVAVDTSGVLSGKTITSISVGFSYACAIASDSQAYCWGENTNGQLGNDSNENSSTPVAVDTSGVLSGKTINSISAGDGHTCAIASDNQAYCWGLNDTGQLGNDSTEDSSTPVAVDTSGVLSGKTVTNISAGYHTCAIASDNQAYCWGAGDDGQLGNSSTVSSSVPIAIGYPAPFVDRLSPSSIDIDSITSVVIIYGEDFQKGATVKFDDQQMEVNYVDSTYISVSVPTVDATEDVTVDVTVTNPNGLSYTLEDGFTYTVIKPYITSISPSIVNADGSDKQVTIHGGNFSSEVILLRSMFNAASSGELTVKFGGQTVAISNSTNSRIDVIVPTAGVTETTVVDVSVINKDGTSVTLEDAFTYHVPETSKINSVAFSEENGQKLLIVNGSGFPDIDIEKTGPGAVFMQSHVSLNGADIPYCNPVQVTGMNAQAFIQMASLQMGITIDPSLVSDLPICYKLVEPSVGEVGLISLLTPTQAIVWLEDDFDVSALGTVSINDSSPFTFNKPTAPTANGKPLAGTPTIAKRPTFTGVAPAGSEVTVTVNSDPVTCTTTADSNGNWSCTLPSDLPAGNHTVNVSVVTPDAQTITYGPYAVTVAADGSSAPITNETPGAPNTGAQMVKAIAEEQGAGPFAIAGATIAGIGALLWVAIRRRVVQ